MNMLDPLAFIVANSLARLGAPVPVQTHPVPSILKQNSAVGCRPAVRLVESAFPIVTITGFWEMLRKFRSEQGDRKHFRSRSSDHRRSGLLLLLICPSPQPRKRATNSRGANESSDRR
jgi:hypothetical protein